MGILPFRRKESPVAGATLAYYGGRARWRSTNPDAFAKEGYCANPDLYTAIETLATAAGGVKVIARKGDKVLDKHPLLDLWKRPNPQTSGTRFLANLVRWQCIAGEFYIAGNGPSVGPPKEMWIMQPGRMIVTPSRDPANPVAKYEYKIGGNKQPLDVENVLHLPMFNPLDDFYGLSPIQVAAKLVDQASAAYEWNLAALQNGGIPPGFLVSDEELSDKAFTRLKKQIKDQWMTTRNAGVPQLLEGGMKWQDAARTPVEMQLLEAQKLFARKFAMVIGVPPELVDGEQKKFANYETARKALYQEGVLPKLDEVFDALNAWLAPKFGSDVVLDYDRDDIEALQEDRDKLYQRLEGATFLTINEKRAELGLPLVDGGDQILVSATMIPVTTADTQAASLPGGGKASPFGRLTSGKAFNLATDDAKAAHWKRVDAQRTRLEGNVKGIVGGVLDGERKRVVAAVAGAKGETSVRAAIDVELRATGAEWEKALKQVYLSVGKVFADQTSESLKGRAPTSAKGADGWIRYVADYVKRTLGGKVSGITDTTRTQLQGEIAAGVEAGESIPLLAKRVDGLYLDKIIPNRSTTIARTETIAASNAGSMGAADATGLPLTKDWISTPDERTREWHQDVDSVALDEAFNVDGEELQFPGDADGSAENVVNCRCTVAYSVDEGGE